MTRDRLASIREAEQREAARTLGVSHVEFLGYNDAEVRDTHSLRLDITRQIRARLRLCVSRLVMFQKPPTRQGARRDSRPERRSRCSSTGCGPGTFAALLTTTPGRSRAR